MTGDTDSDKALANPVGRTDAAEKLQVASDNRLLDRQHFVSAFWAGVVGIAGFFGGRFWERSDPPQPVVVSNPEDLYPPPTTTVVRATAELDEASRKDLQAAADAVRSLVAQQKRSLDQQESEGAIEFRKLQEKLAALQEATDASMKSLAGNAQVAAVAAGPRAPLPPSSLSLSVVERPDPPVRLVQPAPRDDAESVFKLPESAKGYWPGRAPRNLTGLACPKVKEMTMPASIELVFSVKDESAIKRMSPLYLSIARVDSADRQTEMFSRFVPIVVGTNHVELEARLDGGRYQLTAGYYLRDRLSGEFPVLYSITCDFAALP